MEIHRYYSKTRRRIRPHYWAVVVTSGQANEFKTHAIHGGYAWTEKGAREQIRKSTEGLLDKYHGAEVGRVHA